MLELLLVAVLAGADVRPASPVELEAVEEAMRSRLKDPDSMRMEGVRVAPGSMPTLLTACGEVNAKNSYGGYTGRRVFLANIILREGQPPAAIVIGVDDGRTNTASSMCRKAGL